VRIAVENNKGLAFASLYLTEIELDELDMITNDYNGGQCDEALLPKRDEGALEGERLAAVCCGDKSEICESAKTKKERKSYGASYYVDVAEYEAVERFKGLKFLPAEDFRQLPWSLRLKLYSAICEQREQEDKN
jgi:hypothetical protein